MTVHPAGDEWLRRDSYLERSEFSTATQPEQPACQEGDQDIGLFPQVDLLGVNMQLENTGLRATIRWVTAEYHRRQAADSKKAHATGDLGDHS